MRVPHGSETLSHPSQNCAVSDREVCKLYPPLGKGKYQATQPIPPVIGAWYNLAALGGNEEVRRPRGRPKKRRWRSMRRAQDGVQSMPHTAARERIRRV
jgi:hypothetical protein